MQQSFIEFISLFQNHSIDAQNKYLKNILYKFDFHIFSINNNDQTDIEIPQYFDTSKIITIDEYQKNPDTKYYFICIEYHVLIIEINQDRETFNSKIDKYLSKYQSCEKYFIKNIQQSQENDHLSTEIENFSISFKISPNQYQPIFDKISKVLVCFLLIKSHKNHSKKEEKRLNKTEYQEKIQYPDKTFVKLRELGSGSCGFVYLIYHLQHESIYAIKCPNDSSILIERERNNYLKFEYPFIAKYFGYLEIDDHKNLLIEYIEGNTLNRYDVMKLNEEEKYNIIFQLMLTIHYVHSQNYIFRDLNLSNIIINESKDAILIDFDRLIEIENQNTFNFSQYNIPKDEIFSFKSDVYSLGCLIYYILFGKYPKESPNSEISFDLTEFDEKSKEKLILEQCFYKDHNKRPNLISLIHNYYNEFLSKIKNKNPRSQILINLLEDNVLRTNESEGFLILGIIYCDEKYVQLDINKAIHYFILAANQNNISAQKSLGLIYEEGKLIKKDIDKAIHYLTLAAEQNDSSAQCELGYIYFNIKKDISKSIHYYSLAANLNNLTALFNLGLIYETGKKVPRDITKSIHYYSLAANQNHSNAQYKLGTIYYEGKDIQRDINKSIHYFTLASNQNHLYSILRLGVIYLHGEFVQRDVNKGIHYFTLAADQNNLEAQVTVGLALIIYINTPESINKAIHYFTLAAEKNSLKAQYMLGYIYDQLLKTSRDINKAIYYYSLAANQNDLQSIINLASIYLHDKEYPHDIQKAIYYLTLAANKNHQSSQTLLGFIYEEGKLIKKDINKAIYYLTLAADQNDSSAQYKLGYIYSNIKKDISKAIHYYSLAAKQNHSKAQFNLGIIYKDGTFVPRDIYKAIHYFELAANNNFLSAFFELGLIYSGGEYVPRDINKAINYYSLAANQNHSSSQNNLALIYNKGKYVPQDVKKAIYYYTLSANNNNSTAQYNLGLIYYNGEKVKQDINKAIIYFTLAANQKNKSSQYKLGMIYYQGKKIKQNINKSIHYLTLAANQNHINALFQLGSIYYEGLYVNYDIKKSIHYFKEASCFNNQYAKNNLGVIYKTGKGVESNVFGSIEYFNEAIRQKNDAVAMFNLAHIYFYEEAGISNYEKTIELLVRSNQKVSYSIDLLCLVLIKKYKQPNKSIIEQEINKIDKKSTLSLTKKILSNIAGENLLDSKKYLDLYNKLKYINLVYYGNRIENQCEKTKKESVNLQKIIDLKFYEGLGNIF